ncbi:hypothetical protein [Methylobacterium sp. Gmos1]
MPLQVGRNATVVTVAGGNLFQIAAEQLGDHSQWDRIARLNGLLDPFLTGPRDLLIPPRLPKGQTSSGVVGA